MFNVMSAIRSSAPGGGGGSIPVTDQLLGQWDAAIGITDDGTISAWADQSGNGNDWTRLSANGPILQSAVLNGLDVVEFPTANARAMSQAQIISSGAGEMVMVCRRLRTDNQGAPFSTTDIGGNGTHFMFGNALYDAIGSSTRFENISHGGRFDLNEWGIYGASKLAGAGDAALYGNDTTLVSGGRAEEWSTPWYLGRYWTADGVWNGQIAEMAFWGKVLSGPERTSVFDYLNTKFGLGL